MTIDRLYEPRARMALDFFHQIAPEGTVYIPTTEYLAGALGWSVEDAGGAIRDLIESRTIKRVEPGVYRML